MEISEQGVMVALRQEGGGLTGILAKLEKEPRIL